LRCHPHSREFFEVFKFDQEQMAELDSFVRHCCSGMRLLDIGAHYGVFALAALHYGGPDSQVLCVEASPAAATVLRTNLTLNGASAERQVLNVAMASADGYLAMLTTGPFSGDYLLVPSAERYDTQLIPARTMDSILSTTQFAPTHLKMDIEGCEVEVIHSSRTVLEKLRPIIFLELHGGMIAARGKDPTQVITDLRECGYRHFESAGAEVDERALQSRGFDCRMLCRA
jgi:FkbM family methyltransferase